MEPVAPQTEGAEPRPAPEAEPFTNELTSGAARSDSPVDRIFNELGFTEGVGDDVTDIPTGELGVTQQARDAVEGSSEMSDPEVARAYLQKLDSDWKSVEGYESASQEVQEALIDASYNMGPRVMDKSEFPGLAEALKNGDEVGVVRNLLDTATVGGKAMKGIAKRRAMSYNRVADVPITEVEQEEDGTIVYRNADGDEIFKYKPRGGRHEKSSVGTVAVPVV